MLRARFRLVGHRLELVFRERAALHGHHGSCNNPRQGEQNFRRAVFEIGLPYQNNVAHRLLRKPR